MKVIFRSNDKLAKKELGENGGAEEWLSSLDKYVSDAAIAHLSLFIDNDVSLATLDIIDGSKHIYSSEKSENPLSAIQIVIKRCITQIKKSKYEFSNDTFRYNEENNMTFESIDEDIIIVPNTLDDFELIELEDKLSKERETAKYKRIVNKYINYLYRNNEIEQAVEHLRILTLIYNEIDKEKTTVADYSRLLDSMAMVSEEIKMLLNKQKHFDTKTKDAEYMNYIIEEETKLAKLKK